MTFWRTTVGKKIVMAVTGVVMILFLVGHLAGNLLVFRGPVQLDQYSAVLHVEPAALWAVRIILLAAVVLHIIATYQLARIDRAARRKPYARLEPQTATFASRTMRVGGIIIAAFIIFHLLHLTTGTIQPAPFDAALVYANVVGGFQIWWVSAIYLVGLAAIGLHLYHGAWSWARTLGLSRPSADPLHRPVAIVIAVLIWAGFTAIPLTIFFGLVR
ncbi:MAG: succinate dehydrogenase cytochrome b subunit [Acidobacteriota bacterium]|nr:succinate dehydrogenase cytochrome b subunit [Acidobacteriota bacterium]